MSFDQRKSELRTRLANAKATLTDAEFTTFTRVIDDYLSKRDTAMAALLSPLADTGDSEINSTWKSQFDSQRNTLKDTLRGLITDSPPPSTEAIIFRAEVAVEDDAFFRSLEGLNLGVIRDQMLESRRKFDKMAQDLKTGWDTTSSSNKSLEAAEMDAAKKVDRLIRDSIALGAPAYAKIPVMMAQVVDWFGGIGKWVNNKIIDNLVNQGVKRSYAEGLVKISDLGEESFAKAKDLGITAAEFSAALPFLLRDPGMVLTDALKDLPGAMIGGIVSLIVENRKTLALSLYAPMNDAVKQYRDQLPNQGVILVCFSQSRKDTDNFVQKNGMDVARQRLDDVKNKLSEWADRQPTDALKSDARDFAASAAQNLSRWMDVMDTSYRALFSANAGRFMGPVSDSTVEELLDTHFFEDTANGIVSLHFDALVRDWTDTAIRIKPTLDNVFSQIQGQLADVGLSVEIMANVMSKIEPIFADLRRQEAEAQDALQKDLDDARRIANEDEVRKLFERKRASEALKSGS